MAHAWKLPSKTAPTRPCARKKVREKKKQSHPMFKSLQHHVIFHFLSGWTIDPCIARKSWCAKVFNCAGAQTSWVGAQHWTNMATQRFISIAFRRLLILNPVCSADSLEGKLPQLFPRMVVRHVIGFGLFHLNSLNACGHGGGEHRIHNCEKN